MKFRIPNLKYLLTRTYNESNGSAQCFNPSKNQSNDSDQGNTQREEWRTKNTEYNAPRGQSRTAPRCSDGDTNRDLGNAPYAFDIKSETDSNRDYRAAIWTGKHLQLTVMSIPVGGETGVEMHNNLDQFIRVESGTGKVEMGRLKSNMNYTVPLDSRYAILIPEGTYHNIINTGRTPLKLYSIYTPKAHPFGTADATKEDAEQREAN